MINHILLLEPKAAEAELLAEQIESHPEQRVHRVRTMREACSVLTEQTIDLAFLPITRNDSLVYSLRMLQPDIPIVLLADTTEQEIPERQLRAVRGVVTKSELTTALPHMTNFIEAPEELEELFWHNKPSKLPAAEPATEVAINPDRFAEIAQQLLQQPFIQFVMFLQGNEIIGYHSTDNQEQLVSAAQEVQEQWTEQKRGPLSTQIQFIEQEIPRAADEVLNDTLLLYTKPVGPYLMTIGANAQTPVSTLRQLVKRIRVQVSGGRSLSKNLPLLLNEQITSKRGTLQSYVLVWKPQIVLNADNRLLLRRLLPQIAKREGFTLQHMILNEQFVHVVASCPPQRSSSWLAQTLKSESEKQLQTILGYNIPIWIKGYYAKESSEPLSAAELNRYLMLKA